MFFFRPTFGENSRNMLNASASRRPSTCSNRDGVNPTPHGVSAGLLSGHTAEQSLALYRELTLGDVVDEYEAAMRAFPVR
jgi:hypothetical protein